MPEQFVAGLARYRSDLVFNPWGEVDADHDQGENAPEIRRRQLLHYLRLRIGRAPLLLVAEAIGYQGGHFTGIPMTSERLLLGGLKHKGVVPEDALGGFPPCRTSREDLRAEGFTEPTATIVWGFFANHGLAPDSFVLWNAFPWHPYKEAGGLLTNRTPTDSELEAGHQVLRQMIQLGGFEKIIAVGEKSARQLADLNIEACKVRHPANGGAGKFRQQMADLVKG